MKHGDFTRLAKHYKNRPGYSLNLLNFLKNNITNGTNKIVVADVGAGTGKLTEDLSQIGLKGFAVEPNDAMREEGIKLFSDKNTFDWLKGTAESTGLKDNSVDWVLMGSSFHWTDKELALKEFHRILKPGGYFTALWNPRNIEKNELHKNIENKIYEIVPELKRVSSGSSKNMKGLEEVFLSSNYFDNLLFCESHHEVVMSKERYLGAWYSVNDIQVQAGPERFNMIMKGIEEMIEENDNVVVPYKTRAWTVQAKVID